jgi:hypothetical protein
LGNFQPEGFILDEGGRLKAHGIRHKTEDSGQKKTYALSIRFFEP